MSMSVALATPGCGCGGSGSSGGCAGCGGTAAANPTTTAFVRPRFFAGQLLTEDDLTALAGYTIAKDQLHNRYLFGAGVVCGLWVSCDPCGGGTVSVAPGYALDCCGRDLVLSCAATLDVNAMIRDLLAAQLGKDCGDPCGTQGTASSGARSMAATRHYRLYARYGEQPTDPVAPYATGDQCGPVTCEPTRIREGISFVLKCPATAPSADDFPSRLRACRPDDDVLRRQERLKEYGEPMMADPAAFGPEDAEALMSDVAAVKEWLLGRLGSDPALADCQLRAQVRAVQVTTKADEERAAKVRSLGRAASELAGLFARVVQDCLCRAVNPPCAPCGDTDVPLACLEVADCTVVSICNAERDYVLSGSALRYWYPTGLLPEVEGCSCACGESSADQPRPGPADTLSRMAEPARAERAAPPAAAESADGALARQVLDLERRVTELTEQLAETRARLSAPGGESPTKADKPSPRPASAPRSRRAPRQPAEEPAPVESQEPADGHDPAATGGSDDNS